tara:strand:- start:1926 stop:3965 length:2040 start_codon:yes stop_codon:yes gene_type:complete
MVIKKKVTAIIQARYNSTRFPGKILSKIKKKTLIEIQIDRLKKSKKIDDIIIACTQNPKDKIIIELCKKKKIKFFRGSEKNVLERYYKTARKYKIQNILRITSDCPLIDPKVLDNLIYEFFAHNVDYASNIINATFPDGFDAEIFSFKLLQERYLKANKQKEKEHVTVGMRDSSKYRLHSIMMKKNFSRLRLTIDTFEDLQILKKLLKYFQFNFYVSLDQILKLYNKNPNFFEGNANRDRNEAMDLNTGQKLWTRAKKVIPGGNMMLSKRPEMFLPGLWPTYFSKSKGCYVWDLDGKKFIDLATMSVGTNILGYSNKTIDSFVIKSIKKGNMTSLNCPEEVYLSEKLIKMHKGFDMVRYAKTGGEANSIAIRIARAYTKKDNVAICGYHGWHDWYLSANLSSKKNLTNHLLPGLSAYGVPKKLINTVFPFEYNDIENFYKICKKNNIGVVKMEVYRNFPPKNNFLKKIRKFCNKNNIILIFDECTSGFRETFGGLHLKYGVTPDICILGKALGNGYPITAVLGKREIMQNAQSTFISSTFWTDRTGYVAAIKTIDEMYKTKSWKKICQKGKYIKKQWSRLLKKNHLKFKIFGLDALPGFTIKSENWLKYKSYITFKMLENSILASNVIYLSTSHEKKIIDQYLRLLDRILIDINNFENNKNTDFLDNIPESHNGFKRLN